MPFHLLLVYNHQKKRHFFGRKKIRLTWGFFFLLRIDISIHERIDDEFHVGFILETPPLMIILEEKRLRFYADQKIILHVDIVRSLSMRRTIQCFFTDPKKKVSLSCYWKSMEQQSIVENCVDNHLYPDQCKAAKSTTGVWLHSISKSS